KHDKEIKHNPFHIWHICFCATLVPPTCKSKRANCPRSFVITLLLHSRQMTNKQTAKEKIECLVIRFEEQFESYKNSDYNETLTRRDFIDPFFKALGWDIDNESGYAEAYREVIHEDKVKVSDSIKAPDYSFRLVGGKRLFFVEAKKPSISVKEDIQPAYQVRRYGWSAKLPIS